MTPPAIGAPPIDCFDVLAERTERATRDVVAAYVESRVREIDARRQERVWLPEEVLVLARILASEIRSGAVP